MRPWGISVSRPSVINDTLSSGVIVLLLPFANPIVGGIAFDYGGLLLPFQIAFCLLVFTTIFGYLFLPYIDPKPPSPSPSGSEEDKSSQSRSFLHPLKIFIPKRTTQANGQGRKRWDLNLFVLGLGAFFSVLATGYVGMGLQLVATNVYDFKPGSSGLMLVSRVLKASNPQAFKPSNFGCFDIGD